MDNIVFFDGVCGLCDKAVQFLLRVDHESQFVFAPLQGETAKFLLHELPEEYKDEDSLVLIENYKSKERKFYVLGKGVLRICWILGGWWSLIGWMNILPSYLFDVVYRFVARNRKKFFSKESCQIPSDADKKHFLP